VLKRKLEWDPGQMQSCVEDTDRLNVIPEGICRS
jgi:hypothetical protein